MSTEVRAAAQCTYMGVIAEKFRENCDENNTIFRDEEARFEVVELPERSDLGEGDLVVASTVFVEERQILDGYYN